MHIVQIYRSLKINVLLQLKMLEKLFLEVDAWLALELYAFMALVFQMNLVLLTKRGKPITLSFYQICSIIGRGSFRGAMALNPALQDQKRAPK